MSHHTTPAELLYKKFVIPVYNRNGITAARARGSWVTDLHGRRYLDLFPGWGVNTLGHCHPRIVKAVQTQAAKLIHVPNTFYHEPQARLAAELAHLTFPGKAFFTNSGAEAVEAAIKLARKYGHPKRYEIITTLGSFHGRTLGALAATGQAKYQKAFGPRLPGFRYAPFNQLSAVERAFSSKTVAVMVEPIQGEGGVHIAAPEYLRGLRRLCSRRKALLILDEITTGLGRTGSWFAYQAADVEPDILLLGKSAAGGLPLGILWARKGISDLWQKAEHATTFGGNPLVTQAGLAAIETIRQEKLLGRVRRMGGYLARKLNALARRHPVIREVRARGLMIGIELNQPCAGVVQAAARKGLLINCTQGKVLRLYPAFTVTEEELDLGMRLLSEALEEVFG
ncbi:MAG: aspartate aminotransferase family protein [Candidatus Omnitrophica bacterium]|nr:aspartate aminotransferase family protein [Candidatus Omnitrophota bacterium]